MAPEHIHVPEEGDSHCSIVPPESRTESISTEQSPENCNVDSSFNNSPELATSLESVISRTESTSTELSPVTISEQDSNCNEDSPCSDYPESTLTTKPSCLSAESSLPANIDPAESLLSMVGPPPVIDKFPSVNNNSICSDSDNGNYQKSLYENDSTVKVTENQECLSQGVTEEFQRDLSFGSLSQRDTEECFGSTSPLDIDNDSEYIRTSQSMEINEAPVLSPSFINLLSAEENQIESPSDTPDSSIQGSIDSHHPDGQQILTDAVYSDEPLSQVTSERAEQNLEILEEECLIDEFQSDVSSFNMASEISECVDSVSPNMTDTESDNFVGTNKND